MRNSFYATVDPISDSSGDGHGDQKRTLSFRFSTVVAVTTLARYAEMNGGSEYLPPGHSHYRIIYCPCRRSLLGKAGGTYRGPTLKNRVKASLGKG